MRAINASAVERCRSTSYVVSSPSSSYIINSAVCCVVNVLFCIAGTILNSLVAFIFWKSPGLRKKIAYFLIMILSLTDLCVTFFVQPLYLVHSVKEISGTANCTYKLLYHVALIVFSGQSSLTLLVMNIERYLAILHPFRHRQHVTKRKCAIALAGVALISTTTGLLRLLEKDVDILIMVLTVIACLVTCFVYVSIYFKARKVLKNRAQQHVSGSEDESESTNAKRIMAKFLDELSMAKSFFLAVTCSFICYLPNGIVLGIWRRKQTSLDNIAQAKVWTTLLVTINSTINCIIFFWVHKELRKKWKEIIS